jgi:hypothetical protein
VADRKEITLGQLNEAVKNGLHHILENVEVKATVVVRDKDGKLKRKLTAGEVELCNSEQP